VIVRDYQPNESHHRLRARDGNLEVGPGASDLIANLPPNSVTRDAIVHGGVKESPKPTPSSSIVMRIVSPTCSH